MKSIVIVCAVLLTCIGFGCTPSSSSNSTVNSNPSVATNANPANASNTVPFTPTNAATIDTNSTNTANTNQTQVKVVTPAPGNAKPMTFPAPDDSEYSSAMDKSGQAIETRVFHNNPLISKVERIWKGVNDKVVNIYLKNGKVIKVPGDKWPEIKSLPVATFYEAAGVKPPQPAVKGTPAQIKDDKPKQ